MIEYAPFTESQAAYYKRGIDDDYWLCFSEGGKRGSKNVLNIAMWAEILETHPDRLHLGAGVSQASAKMNIMDSNGFGLKYYFEGRCTEGNYLGVDCLYIDTITGQKIVLFAGGKDAISYRSIKGYSLGTAYVTEANECHKTFVQECFDRTLASNRRKVIFDFNAKPPRHWFYVEIVDFHVDPKSRVPISKGVNYGFFTIHDNMSLSDEQLQEALASYPPSSLWFQAEILGKRTSASGRVYTGWDDANIFDFAKEYREYKNGIHNKWKEFSIGIDVGGTDATVATLSGFHKRRSAVDLLAGFYHKQSIDTGMTHLSYARLIVSKILDWVQLFPRVAMCDCFIESADKLFRQAIADELARVGLNRIQIYASYKAEGIVDRIRLQNILIAENRLRVDKTMKPWIEAYEQASWSTDEYEKGDWVRIDDGSYPVDCLDSSEYGTHPFKEDMLKGVITGASNGYAA